MQQAGNYWQRYTWLQYTLTKDNDTGQNVESWEPIGTLWGYTSANKKLKQETEFGVTVNSSEVEIRLKNYPEVDAKDRLIDLYFGNTYRLKGVQYGVDEVIVEGANIRDEQE